MYYNDVIFAGNSFYIFVPLNEEHQYIDMISKFFFRLALTNKFVLESDLLYSPIVVGCPNPPINGGHCTQVVSIPPSSRGLKKHNEDYPIMEQAI